MKLNFANPATGQQKMVEIDDETKYRIFYEKRMGQDVEIDSLGSEWKGYVVKVKGGNDVSLSTLMFLTLLSWSAWGGRDLARKDGSWCCVGIDADLWSSDFTS